jgi:hypothetical protein
VVGESRQGDSADYDDEGHSEDLRQTDIQFVMVAIKKRDVWGTLSPVNAFCSFKDILGTIVKHLP